MGTSLNKRQWAIDFLHNIGNPSPSAVCVNFVHAWEEMESGAEDFSPANWNPLNTTQRMPGSTNFNSAGVQNFTDYNEGIQANSIVLRNGLYPTLLHVLGGNGNPLTDSPELIAEDLSVWVSGRRTPVDVSYVNGIIQITNRLDGSTPPPPPQTNVNQQAAAVNMWKYFGDFDMTSGIAQSWIAQYMAGNDYGCPLKGEMDSVTWNGAKIKVQVFSGGWCEWHEDTADGDFGAHWYRWLS